MSTAEELLNQVTETEYEDIPEIVPYITIDMESRQIMIPTSVKNIGVESDDEVKRLWFKMERYYHDCDLSQFRVRINYLNANGDGDLYEPDDVTVNDDDTMIFSWLVGRYALVEKGTVTFSVCVIDIDHSGRVDREFNTTIAKLTVLEGLETVPTFTEEQLDAFTIAARNGAENVMAQLDGELDVIKAEQESIIAQQESIIDIQNILIGGDNV